MIPCSKWFFWSMVTLSCALCGCAVTTEESAVTLKSAPQVVESVAPDFASGRDRRFGASEGASLDLKNNAPLSVKPSVRELPLEVERKQRTRLNLERGRAKATTAKAERQKNAEASAYGSATPAMSEARYRKVAQERMQRAWERSPEGATRTRLSRGAEAVMVEMVLHLTPDGKVGTVALLKGSGSPEVDEALLRIARSLTDLPAPPRDAGPVFILLRL